MSFKEFVEYGALVVASLVALGFLVWGVLGWWGKDDA